ncbi:MAG: DNA primase [Candidatus Methanoperedens nitroreducens]|uniref:DNA primase DnaG n=1 Tax=Candidatus Methanoperedens nitratireducens TaxID=1392998 RepID=A0A0P8ABW0_9EURY|nr:DNA primase DnaG [Candidatus Methanoperedens sp. BLZ2]KAB2948272.1 MAG: DNA primase [Candidatus Methanoperedens sp.]KPQ44171.1 MAG: DNA primase [Candidatus Methanoperedens sp. BLZ1]MBZ0174822.1 DNA primase [Candidatus Methanoperedens nitroreducens]MCX9076975.1 DNA primase DnaG [Candidatus Methanoperedens sp.]
MQNSDTTKYIIHATIKADGVIERPDVVGAIFGQTEGLIGADLDLRELQKSGRIGRLEVNIKSNMGKSAGTIDIPSSLDKVETAVLAASLETIDRIGPCISNISIVKIEDVRSSKRKQIVDRAKQVLTAMFDEMLPESQEIIDEVRQSVRIEEMTTYGKDNIPMGPNVLDSDAIIVVEGRADVLNLLRYGIKNAIAVGGTNVPQAVADLCKKKTVTAFTDGDRGGELIIKELLQVADVDFIARAPDGKGVEELVQKEVVKSLRQKIPVEQAFDYYQVNKKRRIAILAATKKKAGKGEPILPEEVETKPVREGPAEIEPVAEQERQRTKAEPRIEHRFESRAETRTEPRVESRFEPRKEPKYEKEVKESPFQEHITDLSGTLSARFIDENNNTINEVPVRDLATALKDANGNIKSIVFDGVITQRIVDIAAEKGIENLVGAKMGNIVKSPTSIHIETSNQL